MNKYLRNTFWFLLILFPILCSCKSQTRDNPNSTSEKDIKEFVIEESSDSNNKYNIFGISSSNNDAEILLTLEEQGILKIDSLNIGEDKKLKFAIVEFASIKFGVNPGLIFMTSRFDKEAIDSLVSKISSFYGEPVVTSDFDDEEPPYKYYKWTAFDPDKPYIFIRPIHSEEGGLTMMWN